LTRGLNLKFNIFLKSSPLQEERIECSTLCVVSILGEGLFQWKIENGKCKIILFAPLTNSNPIISFPLQDRGQGEGSSRREVREVKPYTSNLVALTTSLKGGCKKC